MMRRFVVCCVLLLVVAITLPSVLLAQSPATTPPGLPRLPDVREPGVDLPHLPQTSQPNRAEAEPPAAAAALAAEGMASWSRIAFQSFRDGNWEIYVADGNGSNQTRLTYHEAADVYPRFNRGCTRLVFASNRTGNYEIYSMNPDGSGVMQLTSNDSTDTSPTWSPDGGSIAFTSYRDGQPEIYVMSADGSSQMRLTRYNGYDGQPAWSPDGGRIAFVSNRIYGTPLIWRINLANYSVGVLADKPYSQNPCWSPDGKWLAFSADTDGDGWLELWRATSGGGISELVHDPAGQMDAWASSWSPDSRYIALTHIGFVYYEGQWYWTEAYLDALDSQTGNISRLSGAGTDWYADWQTIDSMAPSSSIAPLPAQSPGPFTVSWQGADNGPAGILGYDVQIKHSPESNWEYWLIETTDTSAIREVSGGRTYAFRCRARDRAGNVEAWPENADTSTTVEALPPIVRVEPSSLLARDSVTFNWSGNDPGGSGIAHYDVQWQEKGTGVWHNWLQDTTIRSALLGGSGGQARAVRARAIDRAYNQGDWSVVDDDTWVTFYEHQVLGSVNDSRGCPIPRADISSGPNAVNDMRVDATGQYLGLLGADGTYALTVEKAGYGTTAPMYVDIIQDTRVNHVLPPVDNLIANGGFESGLAGWVTGGQPEVTDTVRHTGSWSGMLGTPAILGPLDGIAEYPSTANGSLDSVIDGDGTLHVVWDAATASEYKFELRYAAKPSGQPWSPSVSVSGPRTSTGACVPALAVDVAGNLHVVWQELGSLMYANKPKGGSWSARKAIPFVSGYSPDVAVDGDDTVHVVYVQSQLGHVSLPVGGTWSRPEVLESDWSGSVSCPALGVGTDNTLHVAWDQHDNSDWRVAYANRLASGVWSTPMLVTEPGKSGWGPDLVVDSAGVVHLVWDETLTPVVLYRRRSSDGVWSEPSIVSRMGDDPRIVNYGPDAVFVTYTQLDGDWRFVYTRKVGEADWTKPILLHDAWGTSLTLASSPLGMLHVTWLSAPDFHVQYRGPIMADTTEQHTLAQTVTIPPTAHQPTLAFLCQFEGVAPGYGSSFDVIVQDEAGVTPLLSITEATRDWHLNWVDLSPWAGQTVTVTFGLQQTADKPVAWANLDEVSLGSWLTPAVYSVTPQRVAVGDVVTLTITGGNFMLGDGGQAPVVRLNDAPLEGVQWVDEHTLSVEVPALAPGIYDLTVVNPSGHEGVLPGALVAGDMVVCPMILQ